MKKTYYIVGVVIDNKRKYINKAYIQLPFLSNHHKFVSFSSFCKGEPLFFSSKEIAKNWILSQYELTKLNTFIQKITQNIVLEKEYENITFLTKNNLSIFKNVS